jgi:hypothetical protein
MSSLDTLDPESLPRRHRLTEDQYLRMGVLGLFAPEARVELIEGEVFDMVPIGTPTTARSTGSTASSLSRSGSAR